MLFAIAFLFLCNIPESDEWLLTFLGMPVWLVDLLLRVGEALVIVAAASFPSGRFEGVWARIMAVAAIPVAILSSIVRNSETVPLAARMGAIIMLLALSSTAILSLAQRYRRMTDQGGRQQIKWVVFGFCVMVIASIVYARLINLNLSYADNAAYAVGTRFVQIVTFLALPAGLVVSLLRYRLYDAEATITRSAAYALLTIAVVVLFAATEKLIEVLGSNILGGNVGAVAGGVAVRETEADRVAGWLAGRGEQRRIVRSDRRVSLMIEEETPVGELLVGPRPDGSLPGRDEIETLDAIADPLARALLVCRQREAADNSLAAQVKTVIEQVGDMKIRLHRLEEAVSKQNGNIRAFRSKS